MSDADPRQLLQQLPAELRKALLDSRAIATNALTRSPSLSIPGFRRWNMNIESIGTATTFGDSLASLCQI